MMWVKAWELHCWECLKLAEDEEEASERRTKEALWACIVCPRVEDECVN